MLPHGDADPSGLIVVLILFPVTIQFSELLGDVVVLPKQHRVDAGQAWLLGRSHVAGLSAFQLERGQNDVF